MLAVDNQASRVPRTLIADDQPDVLAALRLLLKGEGFQTHAVASANAALEAIQKDRYDIVLMDLNYARDTTSGREGLDLISRIKSVDDTLPVIAMTAWGTIDLVVEAMHLGVRDFVLKPWDNSHLLKILRDQIESGRREREQRRLHDAEERITHGYAQELEESRRIQQRLLPKRLPGLPGFEIAHAWRPARAVGGDYFDVMKLGGGSAAFCIADVEGKGMPAALLMSNLQAAVKACVSESALPSVLCGRVNRLVCENTAGHKFITFFYGLLDAAKRRFAYCNAGHCAPILVRQNGHCVPLKEGGAVFGVFPGWSYGQGEVEIGKDDCLILFTDGVTEARNSLGEEFGEERLMNIAREHRGQNVSRLRDAIISAVARFTADDFDDDVTLIVLSGD